MTEQEAIEVISKIEIPSSADIPAVLEAFEIMKKATEKQIAKKPVKRSFIVPYEGINVCPSCKEPLPSSKEHHCKCGQKLDWRE